MASKYKLTYYNLRARGEPTRLVLAYAGVDYEDVRIPFDLKSEEWLALKHSGKCPFGLVPILEVEGVTLCESMAILRFVAKRHGLMPSNDLQQAKADMFAEGVYGLENEIVRAIVHADPAQQKVLMEKFNKESLPRQTKYFEKILEKNSKDEVYCVGNKLSFADICFFSFYNSYIAKGQLDPPDVLKDCPRLTTLYKKVRDEPKIKEWIEKRPETAL
nr:glutathione S-transferase-like [Pocillopora verrucosa]